MLSCSQADIVENELDAEAVEAEASGMVSREGIELAVAVARGAARRSAEKREENNQTKNLGNDNSSLSF